MFRFVTFCLLATVAWLAQPAALGADEWTVLKGCEFVPENYHDGDSFSLRTRKKGAKRSHTYIFRLYGADCPESTDTQEPLRIVEQAQHFRLPPVEVSKWGRAATAFTSKALRDARDITVITRKTEARGQSRRNRYYAFVRVDGKDLAGLLVENGLARAYGMSAAYDGQSAEAYRRLLDRKERTARRNRAGLWKESQLPQ
jgi:endonuclease YncB( thermonuclease family)